MVTGKSIGFIKTSHYKIIQAWPLARFGYGRTTGHHIYNQKEKYVCGKCPDAKAMCCCSPDTFTSHSETYCSHFFLKISLIFHLQLDISLCKWTLITHLAFSAFFFFSFPECTHKSVTRREINNHPPFTYPLETTNIFSWIFSLCWQVWCAPAAAVFQEQKSRYFVIFFQGDSWERAAVRLLQSGGGSVDLALERKSFFIFDMINK